MTPLVKRGLVGVLAGALVVGVALFVVRARGAQWRGDFTVEALHGSATPTTLEVCASGHADLGFVDEQLFRFGFAPTDISREECVVVSFSRPATVGTYSLSGDGERRVVMTGEASFASTGSHSPEVRSVSLETSCFCSSTSEPVHFGGTLTLTQVEPSPRGELSLEVSGTKTFPPLSVEVSLQRLTWRAPGF
jgi:hypothetical protein